MDELRTLYDSLARVNDELRQLSIERAEAWGNVYHDLTRQINAKAEERTIIEKQIKSTEIQFNARLAERLVQDIQRRKEAINDEIEGLLAELKQLQDPDSVFDEYLKSGSMLWHFNAGREMQRVKLKDAIIAKMLELEGLKNNEHE